MYLITRDSFRLLSASDCPVTLSGKFFPGEFIAGKFFAEKIFLW